MEENVGGGLESLDSDGPEHVGRPLKDTQEGAANEGSQSMTVTRLNIKEERVEVKMHGVLVLAPLDR